MILHEVKYEDDKNTQEFEGTRFEISNMWYEVTRLQRLQKALSKMRET
jgi:hypothetical protein